MTVRLQHLIFIAIVAVLMGYGTISFGDSKTAEKKLIEYGWDCPDTAYVRANIAEMEKSPFGGVVILVRTKAGEPKLGGTEDVLGWKVFGKEKFTEDQIQHAIDDLAATPRTKLTDNFIQVISNPGNLDWFDDAAWESVLHNIRLMARVAKKGGCAGIMFDAEEYGHMLWTHAADSEAKVVGPKLPEYQAQLRSRGQDFIRAINEEFPDIKILLLFGPSVELHYRRHNLVYTNLLPPFLEGMCVGASEGTRLIDGYEHSYAFRSAEQFAEGRRNMSVEARRLFKDTGAFDDHMQFGFGLWLDNQSGRMNPPGWFPNDPEKNFFQPDQWKESLIHALKGSDEYVWIYSERAAWWPDGPGKAYVEATPDALQRINGASQE